MNGLRTYAMELNSAFNETQIKKRLLLEHIEVKKWLEGKNEGTKRVYLSALLVVLKRKQSNLKLPTAF